MIKKMIMWVFKDEFCFLVKTNSKSFWLRLPDGSEVKRKFSRDLQEALGKATKMV